MPRDQRSQRAADLTKVHQAAQKRLGETYAVKFAAAWALLEVDDLDGSTPHWLAAVTALARQMRSQSARLAATYVRAYSAAEAGAAASPIAAVFTESDQRALEVTLTTRGPLYVKALIGNGYSPQAAMSAAQKAAAKATVTNVLDGGRNTVRDTVRSDSSMTGWRRILGHSETGPCPMCRMLSARGAVYAPETARFGAHDNCSCQVEPAYGGEPIDVHQYVATSRNISATQKQNLKRYLHENFGGPKPTRTQTPATTTG